MAGAPACPFCGVAFVGAPPAPPAGVDPEVVAHLRAGNKLGAIKAHRTRYKSSLAEAKEAVERIEAQLRGR